MKQANSTEIDRLLQRHARRWNAAMSSGRSEESGGESGVGASQAGAGAHLDADEMSAYAEGALPVAAHARYIAHLADCDSCRKIVTDLMLTEEVKAEEAASTAALDVAPSKSWWSAIAALFAPPVMRYAMPALLLVGIVVVALVATRNRKEDQLVALNEQKPAESAVRKDEAPPSAVQPTPGESTGANTSTPTTGTNQPTAQPSASPSDGLLAKNKDVAQTPPAPITVTKTPESSGAPGTTAPEQGRNLNDQLYENIPKDAPPPPAEQSPAASKPVEKERTAEEKRGREQNEVDKSSRTETSDLARSKDEARDNAALAGGRATGEAEAPQAGAKTTATRTRPAARRAGGAGADAKGDLGSSTETRSVEGRRFRRQGNAWVDTAYKSSRSTINVARGSDQYRALVADEPRIGSIANQLGGEIILIWMGKAYRIY